MIITNLALRAPLAVAFHINSCSCIGGLKIWVENLEYINNSLHLARKYAGIFVRDIICSEKRTVFRERSSRKTVSFEEQIMPKDKYPSIFSPQMEAVVFIILQIFFAKGAALKIGGYLTIRPVARKGYESIAHEARPNGLLTRGPWGRRV